MIARWLARWLALVVGLVLVGLPSGPARAHGLHPGVFTLVEHEPGVLAITFTEPVDTSGGPTQVELELPAHCRRDGDRLDCTPAGLHGTIAVRGLRAGRARVMVLVQLANGRTLEAMLTAEAPTLHVDQAPGRSAWAWLRLGVEHVLGGLDHLAFVLGLLLVVGTTRVRRLALTITAFTLAHSVTLALAVTDVLVLSAAPVEATIAASVVLVAREATHDAPTLTRRAPWVVALLFGLVHGLGFAGALRTWGLPEGWVGWSLVWFNLGIELGQLGVVLGVVLLALAATHLVGRRLAPLRRVAAYAIGGLGAWWLLARTVALVTAAS